MPAMTLRHNRSIAMSQTTASGGIHRITRTPGVQGGRACVQGTRIPVASIVLVERELGGVDGVRSEYPPLSAEDVADALAYYIEHRDEVDAFIAELTDESPARLTPWKGGHPDGAA
jgi:uncharacterized protein (DUF433 family)